MKINELLDQESSSVPIVVDHHVVYFIDSYIHRNAFLLVTGRHSSNLFQLIKNFQIRHLFLFQQTSHQTVDFIDREKFVLDSNFSSNEFQRFQNNEVRREKIQKFVSIFFV